MLADSFRDLLRFPEEPVDRAVYDLLLDSDAVVPTVLRCAGYGADCFAEETVGDSENV